MLRLVIFRFFAAGAERQLRLSKKYEELEKSGRLDKYLEKKLKRKAQKEHKRIPRARIDAEQKQQKQQRNKKQRSE